MESVDIFCKTTGSTLISLSELLIISEILLIGFVLVVHLVGSIQSGFFSKSFTDSSFFEIAFIISEVNSHAVTFQISNLSKLSASFLGSLSAKFRISTNFLDSNHSGLCLIVLFSFTQGAIFIS